MTSDLTVLAESIARNREIAGLHYPKDSEGGAKLADLLNSSILTDANVSLLRDAITAAKGEWT